MSGVFRVLVWLSVILGALFGIGYFAYFDIWTVPMDDARLLVSVEPSLRGGDVVLVDRHGTPALGNLVRCVDPDEPRRFVAARLIGTSNALVKLMDQGFSTEGSHPSHPSACEGRSMTNPANGEDVQLSCHNEEFAGVEYQTLSKTQADNYSREPDTEMRVPPGQLYLMSDNRYMHLDSRDFGSVPASSCRHIIFRLWGADGFVDGSRRFNITW